MGIETIISAVGAVAGLMNKPKQAQMPDPPAAPKPPQESKAPDRAAISAEQKAAATLFGAGGSGRPEISLADTTLGRPTLGGGAYDPEKLKGNDKLGA